MLGSRYARFSVRGKEGFRDGEQELAHMQNCLSLAGLHDGVTITHCIEKLRDFCRNDAFPCYDVIGYKHSASVDTFHPELLSAVNSAMRARSKVAAWTPFLDVPLPALAVIPLDADLVDASDEEYAHLRGAVRECFRVLTAAKWITDMAASKMLHLKRPSLIPISDSYVREALAIPNPSAKLHPWRAEYCAARAVSVMDALRAIGRTNQETLFELQQALAQGPEPYMVSKARILDILLWTDMAIGRHSRWTPLAAKQGWASIASKVTPI